MAKELTYEEKQHIINEHLHEFEEALRQAWKQYNEGARLVDQFEDDYIQCAHAKGFRDGFITGLMLLKKQFN